MSGIIRSVRAASVCQASRVVYGGIGAMLLWRETNNGTLGYWYTATSWLSLLMFIDFGFTATMVDKVTGGATGGEASMQRSKATALAAGFFLLTAFAVLLILGALGFSGRMPSEWHILSSILALAAANYAMSINSFQLSLLQALGNWERSQYLPVIPYLLAASWMVVGILGAVFPIGVLALSQCLFSFGLLGLLDRELWRRNLCEFRILRLIRSHPNALRGIFLTDIRYYYSIMASAAIMRLAMFAGSLKMQSVELGDIGRLNQTLLTVISVCFFPINGLANRVIGEVRGGKNTKGIHRESMHLMASAFGLALVACFGVLFLVNQRFPWMGSTSLSFFKQGLLVASLLIDALAVGVIPVLAYLRRGDYWKSSVLLVALSAVPWCVYLTLSWTDFVWVKIASSILIGVKIVVDYRRETAND